MEKKKALLVTTVSGFIPQFEMNSVAILQENGYEVHYATNYNNVFYGKDNHRLDGTGIIRHQIDFSRSPYSAQIVKAFGQLNRLLSSIQFDVIHCHTPIGGMLARLLGGVHHVPIILYTAHGFHFYKGAPLINHILYRTMEKWMARSTNGLITINREDYQNASGFSLREGGKVYYLPGAGIDTGKFAAYSDRRTTRKQLGIAEDDFVVLSVGELNANKNHELVIRAIAKAQTSGIRYLICGEGENREKLLTVIRELHLNDCVSLLGYREDIPEICHASDVFAFPSIREGLPVSLMEAMAAGLPVLASAIRGNVDLVTENANGFLLPTNDCASWSDKIRVLSTSQELCKEMGELNAAKMLDYDKGKVKAALMNIYQEQGVV